MHPAFGGIWTLLLFLVVIGSIGLGLMIALVIFVFCRRNRETPSQTTVHNQESPRQEDMSQIMQRIDDHHREDTQTQNRRHYWNLSWLLYGFAIAVTNLAIANVNPLATIVSTVEAVIFVLGGIALSIYATRFR